MTLTIKRVVGIVVAASALLVPASALAAGGPVAAPAIPGVSASAGTARRPRQAGGDDAHPQGDA